MAQVRNRLNKYFCSVRAPSLPWSRGSFDPPKTRRNLPRGDLQRSGTVWITCTLDSGTVCCYYVQILFCECNLCKYTTGFKMLCLDAVMVDVWLFYVFRSIQNMRFLRSYIWIRIPMFYRCWTLTSYELITILDFFHFCVSVYFSRFQRSIPLVIKSYLAKYSIYQVLMLDVGLMPYNVCRSLILVVCFQGSMPAHKKRSHEVLVSGQATPGVKGFGRKAFSDVTNVFFTPRDKENAQKKPRNSGDLGTGGCCSRSFYSSAAFRFFFLVVLYRFRLLNCLKELRVIQPLS